MDMAQAQKIIRQKYKTDDFKFIGSGSDSFAFRVGDKVIRFSKRNQEQYLKEAAVCDFIREDISVPIPSVKVVSRGDIFYVEHKMIMGGKWSWHKFMWQPRKQRNLADSLGKFMAQLHGVDTRKLRRAVPAIADENIPYVKFDDVADWLSLFMGRRRLEFFRRNYERIVNARVPASDKTLIHMGIKGPNSVVDETGAISGVFDFCNCGIYERWREFAIMYLCRNRALYNQILRAYEKYSGVAVKRGRIIDLAVIEFMWEKRRKVNGQVAINTSRFIRKNIAAALCRFNHLPKMFNWFFYMQVSIHQRRAIRK